MEERPKGSGDLRSHPDYKDDQAPKPRRKRARRKSERQLGLGLPGDESPGEHGTGGDPGASEGAAPEVAGSDGIRGVPRRKPEGRPEVKKVKRKREPDERLNINAKGVIIHYLKQGSTPNGIASSCCIVRLHHRSDRPVAPNENLTFTAFAITAKDLNERGKKGDPILMKLKGQRRKNTWTWSLEDFRLPTRGKSWREVTLEKHGTWQNYHRYKHQMQAARGFEEKPGMGDYSTYATLRAGQVERENKQAVADMPPRITEGDCHDRSTEAEQAQREMGGPSPDDDDGVPF